MRDMYDTPDGRDSKVANYVPEPVETRSIMEILAALSQLNPAAYDEAIEQLIKDKGAEWFKNLRYDWTINGRPKQFPPQPMDKWRAWVCLAGRGWGKLEPLSTQLLTVNRSWITLGELEVGDYLFDEHGLPTKVTHLHPIQIPERAYRLTFDDGTTLDCGGEHRFVTFDHKARKALNGSQYVEKGEFPYDWVNWESEMDRSKKSMRIDDAKLQEIYRLHNEGVSIRGIVKQTGVSRNVVRNYLRDATKQETVLTKTGVKPERREAEEIYLTQTHGKRGDANHSIPNCLPLQYPEKILPTLHPYILGCYIGNGTRGSGTLTQHPDDAVHLKEKFELLGLTTTTNGKKNGFGTNGFLPLLREAGVYEKKHIPRCYLEASVGDRLELLRGLMDTDGTIAKDASYCEFSQSNEEIAYQVYELIVSLGMKCAIRSCIPKNTVTGLTGKRNWRLRFTPTLQVFSLPSKMERYRTNKSLLRYKQRMITKVETIVPVPMRCITVDSPNALYLTGKSLVPSSNTKTGGNTVDIWVNTHKKGTPPLRIALVGATASDVNNVMIAGDALCLNTKIPTPTGFKLMRDIHAGDVVFDEKGGVCNVLWESPVRDDRDCYQITFSNGQVIKADGRHKWSVLTRKHRKDYHKGKIPSGIVRTTEELFSCKQLLSGGVPQHAISIIPNGIQMDNIELPIPPYTLGYWLGDGKSNGAEITTEDIQYIPKFIEDDGFTVTTRKTEKTFGILKFRVLLKEQNLLNNKHIPDIYFTASQNQKLELIQGLMDSDGSASKSGSCEFGNNNTELINGLIILLQSCGIRVGKTSVKVGGYYKTILSQRVSYIEHDHYTIRFKTDKPVFKLPRKLNRQSTNKNNFHFINKIEKIPSVPVKCISVDSPSHLYLASESFIATHNSGILSNYPDNEKPEWQSTNRKVIWKYPDGEVKAIAETFSAEEPGRLRGPQFHYAWCDELAAWRYQEAWDMLMFGLRLGDNPQVVVTTTPRPYPILLELLKLPTTYTTIGSTYENRSNLAPAFFTEIITKYEGSTLGRQELMAEIIEEVPNAMWTYDNLDENRISYDQMNNLPEFLSVVLAIDPATSTRTSSAETGMCVAAYGEDDHFYILHLDAVKMSPEKWARRAIRLFDQYSCDKMIAEVNNGGDLVEAVIKAANPLQKVYAVHASRGKTTRAEPIAALYEQNRVHHIGRFTKGEEQMCVIGDTNISAYSAKQISSRRFTGKLITVKTIDSILTLTYNHPVFTKRGWVEAEHLTNEDVLYYSRKELQSIRIEDAYKQSQQENSTRTFKVDGDTFIINSLQNEKNWARDKRVGNFRPPSNETMQSNSNFRVFQDYECSPITEIRTEEVRDIPVYNLSTSTEWYVANGFITHNCAFNPLENPYGLKDMVDAMVWAMTWLVETTQGRNTYRPVVGGHRNKLTTFRNNFKY